MNLQGLGGDGGLECAHNYTNYLILCSEGNEPLELSVFPIYGHLRPLFFFELAANSYQLL